MAACIYLGLLGLFSVPAQAQIAAVVSEAGKRVFVNAEPPVKVKVRSGWIGTPGTTPSRATIYLPAESSLTGKTRQSLTVSRDGVDRIVHEAAQHHHVDPALIRAVIQTESNWNPSAVSRRGAVGLMQIHPGTARRFGVGNAFNPEENIEAGVRYLRVLLDRYSGNLDLALAAYNAGEGAVDRARGIPHFRETRLYVQKVTQAYFQPGSGRLASVWNASRPIYKETDERGRVVFTNE